MPPTIDLKQPVRQAIRAAWPDFARRHPHLAAALDETLLVPHVADLLEDDPAYRHAMAQADAAHAAAVALDQARRFVLTWLERLG